MTTAPILKDDGRLTRNIEELAPALGISGTSIRTAIRKGTIRATRIGSRTVVPLQEVRRLLGLAEDGAEGVADIEGRVVHRGTEQRGVAGSGDEARLDSGADIHRGESDGEGSREQAHGAARQSRKGEHGEGKTDEAGEQGPLPVAVGGAAAEEVAERHPEAGRREHGVFYNDRVFLFSSEDSLNEFARNPTRYSAEITSAMKQ